MIRTTIPIKTIPEMFMYVETLCGMVGVVVGVVNSGEAGAHLNLICTGKNHFWWLVNVYSLEEDTRIWIELVDVEPCIQRNAGIVPLSMFGNVWIVCVINCNRKCLQMR